MNADTHKATDAVGDVPDLRKVFVIYGRNNVARSEVFKFLRSIGLDPIEWSEALQATGEASPYIGTVLDVAFNKAQAIVVLQTPDDVVYLDADLCSPDDPEGQPQGQPRPNVLFEAGMAMGLNPKRTVIVEFGPVKAFSDIGGRHVVRLDNDVARRQGFAQRLETAGCAVNLFGTDWHSAGDLTPPLGPGRGRPLGKKIPKTDGPTEPRLDARHIDHGSGKIDGIEIINHGPGDVFELDVIDLPEKGRGHLRNKDGSLPIPRLPSGKSVEALMLLGSFGDGPSTYLTITVVGKTGDGNPIKQDLFVSMRG